MLDAFPLTFALGALASLIWLGVMETAPADRPGRGGVPTPIARVDAGLAALVGGLVGARVEYVGLHAPYFFQHVGQAVSVWQGGLSLGGGAVGAGLAVWIFARISRHRFGDMADCLAAPAALVSFSVWFGCLMGGCAYGFHTLPGIFTAAAPDWLGVVVPRWPTQAAGAIYSLLVFGVLVFLGGVGWSRSRPGRLGALSLLLLAIGAAALGLTRADPVGTWLGLRADIFEAAALGVLALAGLAVLARPLSE